MSVSEETTSEEWDLPEGLPDGPGFVIPYEKGKTEQNIIKMTNNFLKKEEEEEEARWQNEQFAKRKKRKKETSSARPRLVSLAAASASRHGTAELMSDYNYSGASGEDGEDALLRQSPVPDNLAGVLASPYGWAEKDDKPLDVAHSLPTGEEVRRAMKKGGKKRTKRRRRSRKKRTKRRKRRRKKRTKRRKRKSRRKR